MDMRKIRAAILLVPVLALAQVPAQDQETPIQVDVDVVNVFCTVHDRRGALSTDLSQQDFQVFEDGRPGGCGRGAAQSFGCAGPRGSRCVAALSRDQAECRRDAEPHDFDGESSAVSLGHGWHADFWRSVFFCR